MPEFYVDDISIEVDEFLNSCSKKEIQEVIEYLISNDYIDSSLDKSTLSYNEQEHIDYCKKLLKSYHSLSKEDCDALLKISSKL